jgi:hypothetical protein
LSVVGLEAVAKAGAGASRKPQTERNVKGSELFIAAFSSYITL